MANCNKWFPTRPDNFRGEGCPKLPHYDTPLSDHQFIMRNIALSESRHSHGDIGEDTHDYSKEYDMDSFSRDVLMSMKKEDQEDWYREQRVRRGDICPSTKWWQDLNSGRRYARGVDDGLDHTINERNNFASGWLNAKYGRSPGGAPYRNTYDPDAYREPTVPMNNFGARHYFYSLHDLEKWPNTFNRGVTRQQPRPGPSINTSERYF